MAAFCLWSAVCAVFFVFGAYALVSKKPVRFWTIHQQFLVSDVKKYNQAVAKLWFVSAVIFLLLGLPLIAGQNSAWCVIPILGGLLWAIMLMAVYTRIEKKYRI